MQLELYIHNNLIETVELRVQKELHPTFSQREKIVWEYRKYLKRKFAVDLMLTKNWRIELVAASELNYLKTEESEEVKQEDDEPF